MPVFVGIGPQTTATASVAPRNRQYKIYCSHGSGREIRSGTPGLAGFAPARSTLLIAVL
jgi:hypothetical protein